MRVLTRTLFPDSERLLATSSCPVHPGAAGVEMWPQPILQIVVADFRLLEPGGASVCE